MGIRGTIGSCNFINLYLERLDTLSVAIDLINHIALMTEGTDLDICVCNAFSTQVLFEEDDPERSDCSLSSWSEVHDEEEGLFVVIDVGLNVHVVMSWYHECLICSNVVPRDRVLLR